MRRSIVLPKPVAYQKDGVIVESRFQLVDTQAGFVLEAYDRSRKLVIDPVISYLTFAGGSAVDSGRTVAVDAAGNMYIAGMTSSPNFPVTTPNVQGTLKGTGDAYISKYSAAGNLIYSTLLGGISTERINKIAVDSQGSVYFCGFSASPDFPMVNPLQALNRGGGAGMDALYGKLNPTGSALVYSSFFGGSYDESASSCVIDGQGHLYIAGWSISDVLPTTPGAFQTVNRSPIAANGFVAKIAPTGEKAVWSTFLGGDLDDGLWDLALDKNSNVWVVGESISTRYPTVGALQPTNRGSYDVVVTKINATGSGLLYSTYLGSSGNDRGTAIALDANDNPVVAGSTNSTAFPVSSNALQRELSGPTDAFVFKLDASGTQLAFSTLFGGNRDEDVSSVMLDRSGSIYTFGTTTSPGIPAVDAVQNAAGGNGDAYLLKLSPDGNSVQMMTYLGGTGTDAGLGMTTDGNGKIYLTGLTLSPEWVPSSNAAQKTYGGNSDAFLAVIDTSTAAVPFTLSSTRLTFSGAPGAAVPSQQFTIRAATGSPAWTIDPLTLSGGMWLSATPRSGAGNATIDVSVNTTGMTAGTYEGTLSVNNTRLGTKIVVAVILTVGESGGSVPNNGVVSGATFTGGAVSPGLLVTIFGTRLGPTALTTATITPQGTFPTVIAETRVIIDDVPAPLVYAAQNQISALVPYSVAGKTTTTLQTEFRGVRSNRITLQVAPAAPGLFTADSSGKGQGAILNEDGTVNSASLPARPGKVIVLYGTGEGATDPNGQDGAVAMNVYPKPKLPVTVRIGGKDAEVLYAGAAPGLVAGVFQINVKIPEDVPAGNVPVVVQVGSVSSSADVTLAVQP